MGAINLVAVGAAVRRIRQGKRLTLEDVSATSGVDTGNLSRIERGTLGWSLETLSNIATSLKVPMAEVFSEAERGTGGFSIAELAVLVPLVKLEDLGEGNVKVAVRKATERVKTTASVSSNAFAFRVPNAVMAPEFRSGEMVVIDPGMTPTFGQFVLVKVDDGVVFRQLEQEGGKTYLHAMAKGYEAILLKPRTHKIIGVARQAIRDLL